MAAKRTMPDPSVLVEWMTVVSKPRDFEASMSLFAPDAVWDMSDGGAGVIEGREEIRAFFEDWLGAYEEYEQVVEEIEDLGKGVVFAVFLQRGRPAGSSGWVEFRDARVLLWADGLVERVTTFLEIDRARSAAERLAQNREQAVSQESTTPDLVELVRRQLEALDRGDLDEVLSSVADDGVLDGRAELIEGRAAIRSFLDDWFRAYEELDFELEEVSDLGGGVLFAVVIQDGRLVGSDGRIRQREGWVYLCVGGSIARLTTSGVDEARAAAERLAQERG